MPKKKTTKLKQMTVFDFLGDPKQEYTLKQKNEYYDLYIAALKQKLDDRELTRNRLLLVDYFLDHWTAFIGSVSAEDFAQHALNSLGRR